MDIFLQTTLQNTYLQNDKMCASQVIFSRITLEPHVDCSGYSIQALVDSAMIKQLCHPNQDVIKTLVVGKIINHPPKILSSWTTHS